MLVALYYLGVRACASRAHACTTASVDESKRWLAPARCARVCMRARMRMRMRGARGQVHVTDEVDRCWDMVFDRAPQGPQQRQDESGLY